MDFTDYRYYLWLAISLVVVLCLFFLSIKKKWSFKTATYVMSGFAILSELTKLFSHIRGLNNIMDTTNGGYIRPVALPLHLCSILIFVVFYMAISNNQERIEKCKSFLVPIGIFGGFLALILATSGIEFNKPQPYQSFIYHSALLWYAIYLLKTKQVSLNTKDFVRNIIVLFSLAIIMIWVNGALQIYETVNFFFVVKPPADGLPFLNLKHGWHAYFAHLCFTGLLLEFIIHLPGIIKDYKAKKVFK